MVQGFWQSIATLIGRRYVQVVIAVLVVTAVCAIGIPRLKFETSQDTLIGKNTRVAQQSPANDLQRHVVLQRDTGHDGGVARVRVCLRAGFVVA